MGFSRESNGVDIAGELQSWQRAGDQQFWKLIVSPEFGDRADLSRLTRELIKQMEKDLGTDLEWVAAELDPDAKDAKLRRLASYMLNLSPIRHESA